MKLLFILINLFIIIAFESSGLDSIYYVGTQVALLLEDDFQRFYKDLKKSAIKKE